MADNEGMFKLYDIRTKIENINDEQIERVVNALALYYRDDVKVSSVVVARDARLYCAKLMEKVVEVFPEYGLDLYFNPVQISTCQFYFTCMKHRSSGGIMITASHNPGNYVGFKLVGPNVTAIATGCGPAGGIEKVKEYYSAHKTDKASKRGKLHVVQYQKEYVDYSMKLAGIKEGDLKGLKVFGEFFSGAAGADVAMAMEKAGADFTPSHVIPDGFFPCGDPNPIIESSIAPSREKMKNGGYDIGFCYDGDGDRMDLMFPNGEQVIPGLNMSIIAPYVMDIFRSYYGEGVKLKGFADVRSIPLAIIEIAKSGLETHIIRNGHSFIKEKLHQYADEAYVVSEEESAHYYLNFPFDPEDFSKGFASTENTLFFTLVSAKAVKENKAAYERAFEIQKGVFRYREWPLHFNDVSKTEDIMVDVEKKMVELGATVIKDMDDGTSLDATLLRFNLPCFITAETEFPSSWCQVAQRISRSEDAMCRWEVVASDPEYCEKINSLVRAITDSYVEKGYAYY